MIHTRQLGIALALSVGSLPMLAAAVGDSKTPDTKYYLGKVVPLADVLKKHGAKLDPDAAAQWMALVGNDGRIYPLIKDTGSRMFFLDKQLLNRPVRLTARIVPDTSLLQVVNVHSYVKEKLHEVYYWCDICTIRGYALTICDCCGGPMELRETPVK